MPGSDIILLPHFDALMQTRSISRAAERAGISQPAMSSALARLRKIFHDPLLVREGLEWTPTQRAIELHQDLQPLLEMWRAHTLPEDDFNPRTSTRTLVLYATDYVQFRLVPPLIAGLAKDAPQFHIRVIPAKPLHGLHMLDTNHAELIAGYFPAPTPELRTRFLWQEPAKCIVRRNHPCLKQHWNLETYLRYGHIDLSAHTGFFSGQIERVITSQNQSRRVAATLSSYLVCTHVIQQTDLIATLPACLATEAQHKGNVEILDVPFNIPEISISLYWHERYQADATHAWLRQYIGNLSI